MSDQQQSEQQSGEQQQQDHEATEGEQQQQPEQQQPESHDPDGEQQSDDGADGSPDDGDTFSREYVSKLRGQAQRYRGELRTAQQQVQDLQRELHTERVRGLGLLADPADLPFDADHLDDPDGLRAAVDQLLTERPHLRARRTRGDIGQHEHVSTDGVSLASLLRQSAG